MSTQLTAGFKSLRISAQIHHKKAGTFRCGVSFDPNQCWCLRALTLVVSAVVV
jgi:hypothetical protein